MKSANFLDITDITYRKEGNSYFFKKQGFNDIEIVIHKDFLIGANVNGIEEITGMVNFSKYQTENEIYFNDKKYFRIYISEGFVSILDLFQWAKKIIDSK